jgi:hypothetical protein
VNRLLAALAVVEAVVIVVLVAVLVTRPEAPATGGSDPLADSRAVAAPSSPAPPPRPEESRRPEAAKEPTATVLHGRVRRADGERIDRGWVSLVTSTGDSTTSRMDPQGYYALVGLAAGTYELHVRAEGAIPHRVALEIPLGAEAIRRDFELSNAITFRIRLVTPDGRDLVAAIAEQEQLSRQLRWNLRAGLSAIATAEPPPARLPATVHRSVTRNEVGELRTGPFGAESGGLGELSIRTALPVHVSALLRHVVLATVRIDRPRDEVEIIVDPRSVLDTLGGVTFRVRREGDPDLEEIRFGLNDAQGGGATEAKREGDRFTIAPAMPGRLELNVFGPPSTWELRHRIVEIAPGETLDLGVLEIGRAVTLSGRVVDEKGEPIAGAPLSYYERELPYRDQRPSRIGLRTDPDGRFQPIGLGPRRYVFRVAIKDRITQAFEVDLTGGPVENAVFRVGRGTPLTLVRGGGHTYLATGTVEDERGLVVTGFRLVKGWPRTYHLAPGRYTVVVDGGRRIPVEVGTAPGRPVVVD